MDIFGKQHKSALGKREKRKMQMIDLLDKRSILLEASPASKKEALDQAITLMGKGDKIWNMAEYRQQVYLREQENTTGIGEGIAIPHGRSRGVRKPGLAVMRVQKGVDFQSIDGLPVHMIFLIAAPEQNEGLYLEVLSKLCQMLMKPEFIIGLKGVRSVEEFLHLVAYMQPKENEGMEPLHYLTGA